MNKNNISQDADKWEQFWRDHNPESEIKMWDYYGLRHWVLKYIPRHLKVLEAGCGLGRYVFYLKKLGIKISGLDFNFNLLTKVADWQKKNQLPGTLYTGDVQNLPFKDSSFMGYLSLGVLEHFIDGPVKSIKEAYRVLKPGGIAIFTTPSVSFHIFLHKIKQGVKSAIKKAIGYRSNPQPFFQYWYRPKKLKKFVESCGFSVSIYGGGDLLYPFVERGQFKGNNIRNDSFPVKFANKFENTALSHFGAQSIVIAIKEDQKMYCFLCGKFCSYPESLENYQVPLCDECMKSQLSRYYLHGSKPKINLPYIINPPFLGRIEQICEISNKKYLTDPIFENFGFRKNVDPQILTNAAVNIKLSNEDVQAIWRKRKN